MGGGRNEEITINVVCKMYVCVCVYVCACACVPDLHSAETSICTINSARGFNGAINLLCKACRR